MVCLNLKPAERAVLAVHAVPAEPAGLAEPAVRPWCEPQPQLQRHWALYAAAAAAGQK